MQLAQGRVVDAEEFVTNIVTIVWLERRWLGEAGVVDVVGGAPGVVDPVRADLVDVVVVVKIDVDDHALLAGEFDELAVAIEVPGVVARDVEEAEAVPCDALAAAGPGHLVEG